jgi:hypothetical protein
VGYNTKKMQTSGGTPRKGVFPRSTFLSLDDTPDTYVSQAGKVCVVKNDETAVEFKAAGVIDDHLVLVINTDTTPGTLVNKLVAGSNITLTTNLPTGNATITIAAPDLVKLQSSSPGTIQTGHINITGNVFGSVVSAVDSVSTCMVYLYYDAVDSGEMLFGGRVITVGSCNLILFPGSGIAGYKLALCYYSAAGPAYRSALEYENPTSPVVFSTLRLMKSGGTIISGANYLSIPHGSWSTVNAYYDPVALSFKRVGAGNCFGGVFSGGTYQFYGAGNGFADSAVTWVSFMDIVCETAQIYYYGTMPSILLYSTDVTYADGHKVCSFVGFGSKAGTPITTQVIGKVEFEHDGTVDDFKSKALITVNSGNYVALALDIRSDRLFIHVLRSAHTIQLVIYNSDSKEVTYVTPDYVNPAHVFYPLVWDATANIWALEQPV